MRAWVPLVCFALLGCPGRPAGGDAGPPVEDAGSDAGIDGGVFLPFSIAAFPNAGGKYLTTQVQVGGTSFNVLIDTGSSGLRVFSSTPLGTPNGEVYDDTFGGGTLCGPTEVGPVTLGAGIATPAPIAFQRVVPCDGGMDLEPGLASIGVQGLIGLSLRADHPQDIYSPLEQLSPPLSSGFTIRTGGYASTQGAIELGTGIDVDGGFASLALSPDPRLVGGHPAWTDTPSTCLWLNGAAASPACPAAYLDTGGNFAIVADAAAVPGGLTTQGVLPSGATFEAKAFDPATNALALDLAFTVGNPPGVSLDYVKVVPQGSTNLGIEVFFHFDVAYDYGNGRLGFKPIGP